MADELRVALPEPGEDMCRYFDERVQSGSLDLALDLSVVEFDELAQLAGVAVTRVNTSDAGIAVTYSVRWTSFHACDDRSFGGEQARVLRGRIDGVEWLFERARPLPTRRDVVDEF